MPTSDSTDTETAGGPPAARVPLTAQQLSDSSLMAKMFGDVLKEELRNVLPPPAAPVESAATTPSVDERLGSSHWALHHTVALVIFVAVGVAGILIGPVWIATPTVRIVSWVITAALLFAFGMIAGQGVTGTYKGLWVDSRYQISLSQFQLVAWMIVILSAYYVMVVWRVQALNPDPLGAVLPTALWVLLGISTGSFVGSSLVKQSKKGRQPAAEDLVELKKDPTLSTKPMGQLATRDSPKSASFADIFTGDEVGNALTLDASKLQMFFFTIVVLVGYALAIAAVFSADKPPDAFPDVNESLVNLLLVSHAGYLAYKAAPHSRTAEGKG